MENLIIHLSHIHNSAISFGGSASAHISGQSAEIDLLLQSLEITRRLIAGLCSQWNSEEELYGELHVLIDRHKALEEKVSGLLGA